MYAAAFLDRVTAVNDAVNRFVWVKAGFLLLIGTGILMTLQTKCFQVRRLGHWVTASVGSLLTKKAVTHAKDTTSISQFQALCTALAATVGVGNVVGVAGAIVAGGPGAVFWMWVAAFFGTMTGFAENVLGIYYRRKVGGEWAGGAMYYLRDGLGSKKGCRHIGHLLAGLFAAFTVSASFGIGNMGQVNTIVTNVESAFDVPALSAVELYDGVSLYAAVIGGVLVTVTGLILFGGMQRIATVAEAVVPVMILLFITGSLIVIGVNHTRIGAAFAAIFSGAFRGKAMWGGTVGVTLRQVIVWGGKRGIFSNEAGLGSSVMVHACSDVKEPVRQGMWSIFEVFTDTMVICTITALVVLTGGGVDLHTGVLAEGVTDTTLVAAAFRNVFGKGGERFVAVAVLLFAFTTVLGWSQYGVKAAEYLGGVRGKRAYRLLFLPMMLVGALTTSSLAWEISDTCNGLMMIPNLIGVVALSGQVRKITQNYVERTIERRRVAPLLSYDPRLQKQMETALGEN